MRKYKCQSHSLVFVLSSSAHNMRRTHFSLRHQNATTHLPTATGLQIECCHCQLRYRLTLVIEQYSLFTMNSFIHHNE